MHELLCNCEFGVLGMGRFLSVQEASDELGVSTKTVRRWISEGRLTARRAGPRLIRIANSDLDKMMSPVGGQ